MFPRLPPDAPPPVVALLLPGAYLYPVVSGTPLFFQMM